jgi:replication factor A1
MVLMDSEGAKIHATVRKTLIYKFKDDLREGKVYAFENMGVATNGGAYRTTNHRYKLNFQFTSIVQILSNQDIVMSPFNFTPIATIVGGSYDNDYLVGELYLIFLFVLKFTTSLLIFYFCFQM